MHMQTEGKADCDWASEAQTEEEKKGGVEVIEETQQKYYTMHTTRST